MFISVFIPFANEEGNIDEIVERVEKGCIAAAVDFELILVDDGSKDRSYDVAKRHAADKKWIKLLRHRTNFGLTEAMKTGFAKAEGEIIVFLPSDLESHPDEDIPRLISGFKDGVDIVCGKREGRGDGKIFLSNIYNVVSKTLFKIELNDMNWIKAFRRECLDDLELRSDWHRFIIQILHDKGYKAIEVPVRWYKRKSGKSHFGLKRVPIAFFDSLAVKFILTFTKAPMRFFGTVGALQMLASAMIVFYMLFKTFVMGDVLFKVRPILYFLVILFLSGLIFFFMGSNFLSDGRLKTTTTS